MHSPSYILATTIVAIIIISPLLQVFSFLSSPLFFVVGCRVSERRIYYIHNIDIVMGYYFGGRSVLDYIHMAIIYTLLLL
jgi:hypothetical protein